MLHAAFAALTQQLAAAAGDASPALRHRIDDLRQRFAAANARCKELQGGADWSKMQAMALQAEGLAAELNQLLPQVDRFDLRTANALWVARDFPLRADYVAATERWYRTGGIENLDFAADVEAARARINGWIEEHTGQRIKNMIPSGSLGADTALVLTNAVYFLGEWVDPFRQSATREEDFLLPDGSRTRCRLMHDPRRSSVPYAAFHGDGTFFATPDKVPADEARRPATYPDDAGFTMIELPYKGDALAMLVIAPRQADGLARIEAMLSPATLSAWVAKLQARTVDTAMLRFEQEQATDLVEALRGLGMQRAFVSPLHGAGAQFAGMTATDDPQRQLFLGRVLHKAWIEVNEKGSEAAAATAVLMRAGAAMRQPEKMVPFVPVFRADRPFLYLIRDCQSGAILFLGRVLDPRSSRPE